MVTSGLFLNTRVAVEMTMHDEQQSTRFDALEKATTAAGIAIGAMACDEMRWDWRAASHRNSIRWNC